MRNLVNVVNNNHIELNIVIAAEQSERGKINEIQAKLNSSFSALKVEIEEAEDNGQKTSEGIKAELKNIYKGLVEVSQLCIRNWKMDEAIVDTAIEVLNLEMEESVFLKNIRNLALGILEKSTHTSIAEVKNKTLFYSLLKKYNAHTGRGRGRGQARPNTAYLASELHGLKKYTPTDEEVQKYLNESTEDIIDLLRYKTSITESVEDPMKSPLYREYYHRYMELTN
ncbi:hypothetical protein JQC92_21505 [Shewanella sp. 202IG2-18]|uniref:hypothetical protein n=1 Tax=Parashewanella hymeniacidonis TaxID=2807618 RepID=UPI00195F7964|nr:hypothetical protein [Parashewanella hymeniacidonis]MBM7074559.1 hypothetical protein [Parashewanella hymeniacidonis]